MPWGKNGCQKKFKELTNLSPLVSTCFLFHLLLINDYNPMLTNTCGLLYLFLFIHPWCSSILYLLAFNVWLPLFLKKKIDNQTKHNSISGQPFVIKNLSSNPNRISNKKTIIKTDVYINTITKRKINE